MTDELRLNSIPLAHDGGRTASLVSISSPRCKQPTKATLILLLSCIAAAIPGTAQTQFVQTNLLADQTGVAAFTDSRLINAWGLTYAPGGPWFVTATDTGNCLVVDGTGAPQSPTAFTVPPGPGNTSGKPTSGIYNGTADFQISPGFPATYLYFTEDGTIAGWNPSVNANAIQKVVTPNAIYKGGTMGLLSGNHVLYGANFFNNSVDVFDANFAPVTLAPGAFQNPAVPTGFAPFNVQYINGLVYVAWAKQNRKKTEDVPGQGNGYIASFNPDGSLVMQFVHVNDLNSPWGFAIAPASNFGSYSGRLMVSQFAGGNIAAFSLNDGSFIGNMMNNSSRRPAAIKIPGIWGIAFPDGGQAGSPFELYFAAGTSLESHGLFGKFSLL